MTGKREQEWLDYSYNIDIRLPNMSYARNHKFVWFELNFHACRVGWKTDANIFDKPNWTIIVLSECLPKLIESVTKEIVDNSEDKEYLMTCLESLFEAKAKLENE